MGKVIVGPFNGCVRVAGGVVRLLVGKCRRCRGREGDGSSRGGWDCKGEGGDDGTKCSPVVYGRKEALP